MGARRSRDEKASPALVDTEGFVLKAQVHSAKVMDYEGIKTLLRKANEHFPRLRHLWVDAGYRGEDKGKDWALRRRWAGAPSSSSVPEKARPRRGVDQVGEGMGQGGCGGVDWQKLLPPKGFVVLPRRWVVERTIAWGSRRTEG
jgi:putative transposase